MAIEWAPTGGTDWTAMTPEQFETETAPEQGSLFEPAVTMVKAKPGPQLDLFSLQP